ncbi:MAG TPA: type III secretion protein [Parachlamydiales bacterium]|nr:type III secretion protein [Parachlamydiales bacterium]
MAEQPTDLYFSFLLTFSNLEPMTILSVFFLTLARVVPILVLAPFMGGKNLPVPVRIMFCSALVLLFLPKNLLSIQSNIPYNLVFIGLMLKELLIGVVLGFLASIPFYVVQMSGSFIDHSRGSSALQVNDPTTQSQTGPIGILFNYVLLAVFFGLNGPFLFFDGLAQSYALIPVDQLVSPLILAAKGPYWKQTGALAGLMFALSVQLAAPAIIGILFTDLFLGIANRLAPQVQIVFLGISLKSWVGIALLTASWALVINVMGKESIAWIKTINILIQKAGAIQSVQ